MKDLEKLAFMDASNPAIPSDDNIAIINVLIPKMIAKGLVVNDEQSIFDQVQEMRSWNKMMFDAFERILEKHNIEEQ